MTRNQAIRCRIDRASGEYNVGDLRNRISRFKQAAEGIRGLVVEDKMRGHPSVNRKLCETALAINEVFGRDDSGPDGRRLRFKHTFKNGAEFCICTMDHTKQQAESEVPGVTFALFKPMKIVKIRDDPPRYERVVDVDFKEAVSIRNPGHGNALDMKPQVVLKALAHVVKELEKRLPK